MIIAPAPGAYAWTSPCCPFLAKKAAIVGHYFVAINLSSTSMQKVYIDLSTEVYFSTTTSYVGKNWRYFSSGKSTGPRITSSPSTSTHQGATG